MAWRRRIAAGAMREWQPWLEEVNGVVQKFGVALPGGLEHVGSRARKHDACNWVVLKNILTRSAETAVFAEVATCTPALALFVAEYYGELPTAVFFQMDSRERHKIDSSSGVQQGYTMGPALFRLPRRPGMMTPCDIRSR